MKNIVTLILFLAVPYPRTKFVWIVSVCVSVYSKANQGYAWTLLLILSVLFCFNLIWFLVFWGFLLVFPEVRLFNRLESPSLIKGVFEGKNVWLKLFDFYFLVIFSSVVKESFEMFLHLAYLKKTKQLKTS